MNYTISRPIFWVTTITAGLSLSVWAFSVTLFGERMPIVGIICYTVIFSPVFVGLGAACGWLVATVYALLSQKAKITNDQEATLKSNGGVSRLTVAIMIGSCFATTITPIVENHMHTIYGQAVFLTWILAFFVAALSMFGLLRILSKQQK